MWGRAVRGLVHSDVRAALDGWAELHAHEPAAAPGGGTAGVALLDWRGAQELRRQLRGLVLSGLGRRWRTLQELGEMQQALASLSGGVMRRHHDSAVDAATMPPLAVEEPAATLAAPDATADRHLQRATSSRHGAPFRLC